MRYRYPVLISIFFLLQTISAASQAPTFSVTTDEVRIDVLVSDNGRAVTDLQASDFEIKDNGVRQEIKYAGTRQMPTSVILVLDMSGSVAGDLHDHLKSAGGELLDGLRQNDRAALITFSHTLKLNAPLTSFILPIREALNGTIPDSSGTTSLIDAAYSALLYSESEADMPLLILFSDGLDTSSYLKAEAVLDSARKSDVMVYAVSAGQLKNRKFLRKLCEISGGKHFEIETTENIGAVFVNILDEFRQRYVLTYTPQGVDKGGWHEVEVRVRKHSPDKILARPGYMAD